MLPARTHLKTFVEAKLPESIYFDSSFIVKTLVSGLEYHNECVKFVKRLEEAKPQPFVFASKLSKMELRCAAIRICITNLFESKGIEDINTDKILYDYPGLISRFYKEAVRIQLDFDNLLQRFTYRQVEDIDDGIIEKAQALMQKYNLGSYDAIHIATAQYWEIKNIVAFDHAIEDISDLNVWTCGGSSRHHTRWYKRSKLKPV
jgi:predicted nucleic acid-binding protein